MKNGERRTLSRKPFKVAPDSVSWGYKCGRSDALMIYATPLTSAYLSFSCPLIVLFWESCGFGTRNHHI